MSRPNSNFASAFAEANRKYGPKKFNPPVTTASTTTWDIFAKVAKQVINPAYVSSSSPAGTFKQKAGLVAVAAAVAYALEGESSTAQREKAQAQTAIVASTVAHSVQDRVTYWARTSCEKICSSLPPTEQAHARSFFNALLSATTREEKQTKIVEITRKKALITKQQALLRLRLDAVKAARRHHAKGKWKAFGKTLMAGAVRSACRHAAFHAVGSFAGTAVALAADAHDFFDHLSNAGDLLSTLDSVPDFDSLDCVTKTYDTLGQYDTFDLKQTSMSQLDTIANNTDQSYQILLEQNNSLEAAYNHNPTLFDSTSASQDPSNIFSHSRQSDILFGSDSRFDTDLKGPNGEALTGTTTGYETKSGNVPVAFTDTKYP